jgi:hypothetical protein
MGAGSFLKDPAGYFGIGSGLGPNSREKGGKKAGPETPDPYKIANATAGFNTFNQSTPGGSLNFTAPRFDRNGNIIQFGTATQTLSPEAQQLFDLSNAAQSAQLNEGLGRGYGSLPALQMQDRGDVAAAMFQKQKGLLDPVFAEQNRNAQTLASIRGLPTGSEATSGENGLFTGLQRTQNNALQNASLDSILNAGQESRADYGAQLAGRGQMFNEIQALLSGQQAVPGLNNFFGPGGNNVAQGFQSQFDAQSQQAARQAQTTQAGLGAASSLLGLLAFSDRRLKRDIKRIGQLANGLPLYTYRFRYGKKRHVGVMADEVRKVFPHAVHNVKGYDKVNYAVIYG